MHKVASYVLIKDDQQDNSDNKILEDLGVMPDSKDVQNQIDIFQSYNLLAAHMLLLWSWLKRKMGAGVYASIRDS